MILNKMLSLRSSIIAALCAQQCLAGPVRRFLNTTSSLVDAAHASSVDTQFPRPFTFPTTSTTETRLQQHAQHTSVDTHFPRPFTFSTSKTSPNQQAGTANSDPDCPSMTVSSNAGGSSLPVITTANPSAAASSSANQDTTHTITAKTRMHHRTGGPFHGGQHGGTGGPFHGGQQGGKASRTSTTTLTLFTTVTPHAQASGSHAPSGSSAAADGSSSVAAGSQTKPTQAAPTSNVATWGTYTITYTPSSSAGTNAAPTRGSKSSSIVPSNGASSSATTTAPNTSIPVPPTVTFSFNPPNSASSTTSSLSASSHSSASAPPVPTQQSPSAPPPPPPTPSSPSGPAGITIVPINTDATTIYVTVTDPGATTTLSAVTVTAFPGGGHRHGPP